MKVNDVIEIERIGNDPLLVISEMSFKDYCDKHDELMLEYDVDEAWEAWQKNGPCFEALHSDGKVVVVWANESR
jgi:hypothetical protein